MNDTLVHGGILLCDECKQRMIRDQKTTKLIRVAVGENWAVYRCDACDLTIAISSSDYDVGTEVEPNGSIYSRRASARGARTRYR